MCLLHQSHLQRCEKSDCCLEASDTQKGNQNENRTVGVSVENATESTAVADDERICKTNSWTLLAAPIVFLTSSAYANESTSDSLVTVRNQGVQEIENYLEGSSQNPKGVLVSIFQISLLGVHVFWIRITIVTNHVARVPRLAPFTKPASNPFFQKGVRNAVAVFNDLYKQHIIDNEDGKEFTVWRYFGLESGVFITDHRMPYNYDHQKRSW